MSNVCLCGMIIFTLIFVRNIVIYRIRERACGKAYKESMEFIHVRPFTDWKIVWEEYDKYSYFNMLFNPVHWLKWRYKDFYKDDDKNDDKNDDKE